VREQGVTLMPPLRFVHIERRSESDVRNILDVTHDVLIETLQVLKRDRCQFVCEHKRSRMIVKDTGLGFVRSDHVLLLQVTSRPRSREMKEKVYRLPVERLVTRCGIASDDVIVSSVTNADEDWSSAQFLAGELSTGLQAKVRIGSPT
jgi:Tautomerase enzyme